MVKIVPFEAWHADEMRVKLSPEELPMAMFVGVASQIERAGGAYSLVVDNEIIACAGTLLMWPGRHQAWAVFTSAARPHMRRVTRFAKMVLSELKGRVEITVVADYEKGHKWARMLGFEVETPLLRCYGPLGEDHVGYVRIN